MEMVEPAFGQIKQRWAFRQFLRQGLEKVNGNGRSYASATA